MTTDCLTSSKMASTIDRARSMMLSVYFAAAAAVEVYCPSPVKQTVLKTLSNVEGPAMAGLNIAQEKLIGIWMFALSTTDATLAFLEDGLDTLLPPVNDGESSLRTGAGRSAGVRLTRLISATFQRAKIHCGLYCYVAQAKIQHMKEDISQADLKAFFTEKLHKTTTYVREFRNHFDVVAIITEGREVLSNFVAYGLQQVSGQTTLFYEKYITPIAVKIPSIPKIADLPELVAAYQKRIPAALSSMCADRLPAVPDKVSSIVAQLQNQTNALVTTLEQRNIPVITGVLVVLRDFLASLNVPSNNWSCEQTSAGADALSTSSTTTSTTGNVTPANSEEPHRRDD